MRIAIACDHGGFPLKRDIIQTVESLGHQILDLGTWDATPVDYPDYAEKAGLAIQSSEADRAIVICGSGVGACVAANKLKGVYASVCHDTYSAHQGVEHDNVNLLCLGARIVGAELAKEIVAAFLNANFLSDERFQRRFDKVKAIELRNLS
ncbi:MAG TPA: ribose 5-phosphate isomerase B [Bellilinea sp.]